MKDSGELSIRAWDEGDDPALRELMRAQQAGDSGWPPPYARALDPADWLGAPADVGRWVAVDGRERVLGHAGISSVLAADAVKLLAEVLPCPVERAVEICRVVVHPEERFQGLAALLTRRAIRRAIEQHRVVTASVLKNRGSWLAMMLATGWQRVGEIQSSVGAGPMVVLLAPQRFVDLALAGVEARQC